MILKSTQDILDWLDHKKSVVHVEINKTSLNSLSNWKLDSKKIFHESGKFFSICGMEIETNWGGVPSWSQPIIHQPEIGILGIISKKINNEIYFLLQAKIEPGNINKVQLSPTLQATKSNYTKVHGGKPPNYLNYFLSKNKIILLDQLQSEQGARFLHKRNRNIIIMVEEDIKVIDEYIWLTLDQIKCLMRYDNIINMDTRSVIAGININRKNIETFEIENEKCLFNFNKLLSWIADQKSKFYLKTKIISLTEVEEWEIKNDRIHHIDEKYFEVIGADVKISNREVINWSQPMIETKEKGLIVFILKFIDDTPHFLVQAKVEIGNLDIIELAPTIQCLTGSYEGKDKTMLPFIEYVDGSMPSNIIYDTMQSEEGGRFYREQNRNMIITVDQDFPNAVPDNFIWMTYDQIHTFMKFSNYVNIQARSLLSAVSTSDEKNY